MTPIELIAILQNIPGDVEILCLTPSDGDDDPIRNDIVGARFIDGDFMLVCTPVIHGERGSISTGTGDND